MDIAAQVLPLNALPPGNLPDERRATAFPSAEGQSLSDLIGPGFFMVLLLRNGYVPQDLNAFRTQVRRWLSEVQAAASRLQISADDTALAQFAYVALLDEAVLESGPELRGAWECQPLQVEIFGEHMAGERFFSHLERLRAEGAQRLELLKVYYFCLLMGFKGRYVLEGAEKLEFLTARVGDEIAYRQGEPAQFAPFWARPDQVAHKLRTEIPLWAFAAVFAALAGGAFMGLHTHLAHATQRDMAAYRHIVTLPPPAAWVSITLP
jgi:type VI secretion system protein ImpK